MFPIRSFVLLSIVLAVYGSPVFRGSESFVVDLSSEEVDSQTSSSSPAPIISTTNSTKEIETKTAEAADVLDAALGLLNTPMNKMVNSNSLRKLLRLLGPSREDLVATLQMARQLQEAVPTTEAPKVTGSRRDNLTVKSIDLIPTDLPPVVDELFGFKEDDDKIFGTTQKPLFPLVNADQESELEKVLKHNNIPFKH
ncbi:unnamed protein product [Auanema sp. JU1783]|nr:unnamed protein product [Auanema sp. JU1783]